VSEKDEHHIATPATITEAGPAGPEPTPLPDGAPVKYEVAGEHARGGLGRVLRAWDRSLNRLVAIKELLGVRSDHARRFVREVEITARLQHPSIVPVYEAGRWPNGTPFFAMKFVSGRSLRQLIEAARTLDERLALLPNMIAVTDAIAYAHSERVLHRDLKPSNVLVGDFGETVVVDWGLAKSLTDSDDGASGDGDAPPRPPAVGYTIAGAVMGTPSYMPPEQARGAAIDARADVYALGAMLYHVLTGAAPFDGETSAAVLEKVLDGPPPPVEQREPGVPEDLAAIVDKAMARDPRDRYTSAGALAEDLRRFQTGQLVGAHRYSRSTLLRRWLNQNRSSLAVAGVLLALLAASLTITIWRIVRERDRAELRSNELILTQAQSQLSLDPTAALAWAKTYPLDGADMPALHELLVDAESRGVARHVLRHEGLQTSMAAVSHDGTRLASEEGQKTIRISDVVTGRALRRIAHDGIAFAIAWTDDDKALVVTNWARPTPGPLELIDVAKGVVTPLGTLTRNMQCLEVRGDEALVAGGDGTVQLWDLHLMTNRLITVHHPKVHDARFSPDGTRIASGGADGRIVIASRDKVEAVLDNGGSVTQLVFTRDGQGLVFGTEDGRVWRWDAATGKRTLLGRHDAGIVAIAEAHGGGWVATGSLDRTVRLWNLADGSTRAFAGHGGAIDTLAFSPDDSILASGGGDTTIRLWHLGSGAVSVLRGHTAAVQAVSFTPDGRWLVSSAEDKSTRVWDLGTISTVKELVGHTRRAVKVAFSPDGKWLASGGLDATLRLWSLPAGTPGAVHHLEGMVGVLAFAPDSARVAGGAGHGLGVWAVTSGAETLRDATTGTVWGLQFSPDGRRLAASSEDGLVRLWTNGVAQTFDGPHGLVRALAFSPDSRSLAIGGDDELVHIWDLTTGAARVDGFHDDVVTDVAFSPDGKALASASWDSRVRLRDLVSGADQTLTLASKIRRLAFSRSGRWLAIADDDSTITLWDRQRGTQRLLRGHDASVISLHFSPDEHLLVSSGNDKTVRVWDVASGDIQRLYRTDGIVHDSAVSVDGSTIATATEDGVVRLWPMPRQHVATEASGLSSALQAATTAGLSRSARVVETE
jgi:WD40 repeat protein/serine/threonine protein kinase